MSRESLVCVLLFVLTQEKWGKATRVEWTVKPYEFLIFIGTKKNQVISMRDNEHVHLCSFYSSAI